MSAKFDINLREGQVAENLVRDLLGGKLGTIEVKRDFRADRTGNVSVEYMSRGKLSGIAATEADWWATVLDGGVIVLMPTARMKEITREWGKDRRRRVSGGDDQTSRLVRVPAAALVGGPDWLTSE